MRGIGLRGLEGLGFRGIGLRGLKGLGFGVRVSGIGPGFRRQISRAWSPQSRARVLPAYLATKPNQSTKPTFL